MSCRPYKTTEANAKSYLRTKGAIDEYLNVINLQKFRELHKVLINQMKTYIPDFDGKLFKEILGGTKVLPESDVFRQADLIKGIRYNENKDIQPDINNSEVTNNDKIPEEVNGFINTLVAELESGMYDAELSVGDIDREDLVKEAQSATTMDDIIKVYKQIWDKVC